MLKSSWKTLQIALRVSVLSVAAMLFTVAPGVHAATGNGNERYPRLGTDGTSAFYAVWEAGPGIYGALSSDNGITWTPPQLLATGRDHWTSQYMIHPNAVTYSNGAWLVYYREFKANMDVFSVYDQVIRSTDGVTWSAPQELAGTFMMLSGIYGYAPVQMAAGDMVSDGAGTVVATAGVFGEVARSIDGGLTWTKMQLPDSEVSVYGRDRYNVSYAGNQLWHIAISGERNLLGPNPGLFSKLYTSADNGTTFTVRNTLPVFESANDLAADGNTVIVMSDPAFLFSGDGGATWTGSQAGITMNRNSLHRTSTGMYVGATNWSLYRTSNPASGWQPLALPAIPEGEANWPDLGSNGARVGIVRSHTPDPTNAPEVKRIIFQYSDDYALAWSTAKQVSEPTPTAAADWQLFQ